MNTSEEWYGPVTEQIMGRWLARLEQRREPRPSVMTYNAAYEAVEEVLRTLQPKEIKHERA